MKMRNIICILLFMIILINPMTVMAKEPYKGYNYNKWEEPVSAPNGYLPDKVFRGQDIGVGPLKEPKDMCVDMDKDIYILDSGNGRIVILNSTMKLKKVIDKFTLNGKLEKLKNPEGIYVTKNGQIYIADSENGRVLVTDKNGSILKVFGKPKSDIFPQEVVFKPLKVLVDSSNNAYVLSQGVYYGAITYDSEGEFIGFYGSNRVEATGKLLSDYIWKKFMTKEQKSQMLRYVPVQYSNFAIDNEDFIYTCTMKFDSSRKQLKKLNPLGVDILAKDEPNITFGDMETVTFNGQNIDTEFCDINVDDQGLINSLDYARGRIFQYDQDGKLLFVFGGKGDQEGTFRTPAAIDNLNGDILVLDQQKCNITVFKLTSFGNLVHKAISLYNEGLYQEAVEPWKEVLKRDSNYEMAYIGIGKDLMYTGDYKEAMKCFKLGYDRKNYSKAYKEYRTETVRKNFTAIVITILLFILAVECGRRRKKIMNIMFSNSKRVGGLKNEKV